MYFTHLLEIKIHLLYLRKHFLTVTLIYLVSELYVIFYCFCWFYIGYYCLYATIYLFNP
jgi:hypothetical protein